MQTRSWTPLTQSLLALILSLSITQRTWKSLAQTIPWPHPGLCGILSLISHLLSTCSLGTWWIRQLPCPMVLWSAWEAKLREQTEPELAASPEEVTFVLSLWGWAGCGQVEEWEPKGRRAFAYRGEAGCLGKELWIPQIFTEHLVHASLQLGLGSCRVPVKLTRYLLLQNLCTKWGIWTQAHVLVLEVPNKGS